MKIISFCFIFLFFYSIAAESSQDDYWIGTGMGDITGPIVQIMMMGYAKKGQTGEGLLQRLYARAYIVIDPDSGSRVVFVNTDTQSMGDIVKQRVVESLQEIHGKTMYTEHNVMLASTHSHSGMGGYLQYTLYEISVYGWIEETVGPMVTGIVHAIEQAHNNLQKGSLTYYLGQLLDTNINRSQKAYLLNPEKEREEYQYDVDKEMRMIGFQGKKEPLGLISWFPVHGVSINGTNRLINGDNKGFASYAIEKKMNPDKVTGKGPFVAAFPQVNAGDVSPNTMGAFCSDTDIPCDGSRSSKCSQGSKCVGRGPGWQKSHFESNRIIGQNQADKALTLLASKGLPIRGAIDYRQKYWDITREVILHDGVEMNLCDPAMGYGFAAGTTDGPAMDGFYQNTTQGTFFWDIMRNVVKRPTKRQRECQAPKAILLNTGEIKYPFDWQPKILDVQLLRVGNVYIVGVPSEFTTMSGRRLQKAVKQKIIQLGMGDEDTIILHTGPSNGYASYCATFEEYQMQRYEGASTPYGPHTLSAYIKVFDELVTAMATGNPISNTEILPNYVRQSPDLSAGYGPDRPALFHHFGDIRRDVNSTYERQSGLIVEATFVAGNPRNDGMLEGTYLTVEEKQKSGDWKVIRTDNDYDTRFLWHSTMPILGHSEAVIRWDIDETTPVGTYRIGYFGHHRVPFEKDILPHRGYSSEFIIV